MKYLPIGISDFKDIINGNYLYVDKTKYIYEMIRQEKGMYFLSRPRRFGKSLLISTLYYLFKGERELFKNTWIHDKWNWEKYPTIRINLTDVNSRTSDILRRELINLLNEEAKELRIDEIREKEEPSIAFRELISKAYEKYSKKLVILIDEYEKPVLDNIKTTDKAKEMRLILREFYSVLKAQESKIKFLLITGLTKFTKMSVFSALNNINDVTFDSRYSQLLGYTEDELFDFFNQYISQTASKYGITTDELIQSIRDYYNGYSFDGQNKVYNPYAVILFFDKQEFNVYWHMSGSTQFIYDYLRDWNVTLEELIGKEVTEAMFTNKEVEDNEPEIFLCQTGYLTFIETYKPSLLAPRTYVLGIPNIDAQIGLGQVLLETQYKLKDTEIQDKVTKIVESLENKNFEDTKIALNSILSEITNSVYGDLEKTDRKIENYERFYQTLFKLIFGFAGFRVIEEYHTTKGRADILLQSNGTVIVIELKVDGDVKQAMNQIKERGYHEQFTGKECYLVAVNISSKERKIIELEWEKVNK